MLAARVCWTIDSNLTCKVSTNDALLVAGLKGLFAGATNTGFALAPGATMPATGPLLATPAVGLAGYGLRLVSFVLALRGLGTASASTYPPSS